MLKEMMTDADYDSLKFDVIEPVVAKAKTLKTTPFQSPSETPPRQTAKTVSPTLSAKEAKHASKMNKMFHGLNATGLNANDYGLTGNDDALRVICETEFNGVEGIQVLCENNSTIFY
jgi:hypothetical protein